MILGGESRMPESLPARTIRIPRWAGRRRWVRARMPTPEGTSRGAEQDDPPGSKGQGRRRGSGGPWQTRLAGWVCLLGGLLSGVAASADERSRLPDVIEQVTPAIVAVGTVARVRQPPARFLGTGFAVGSGRHVVTNHHVLPEDLDSQTRESLAVFVGRGKQGRARKAEVVAVDRRHDLAILRVAGRPLPAMDLGSSERVRAGQTYAFTGFPIGMVLGLHPVTHEGIVSSVTPIATPLHSSRRLSPELIKRLSDPYSVFQLDATAYPGNSGSPLYNPASGRVVGVINMVFVKESKETILEKPSGITYAIPIRFARDLLKGVE